MNKAAKISDLGCKRSKISFKGDLSKVSDSIRWEATFLQNQCFFHMIAYLRPRWYNTHKIPQVTPYHPNKDTGIMDHIMSDRIVVIPPFRLFGIFIASFDVERVIGRPFLIRAGRQHRDNGETNCFDGQRGRPILCQNRKADVSVAVDVGMDGHVGAEEDDDRRVERISLGKLERESEKFAVVERGGGAFEIDGPFGQIVARFVGVDGDPRRRIRAQVGQLLFQATLTGLVRGGHCRLYFIYLRLLSLQRLSLAIFWVSERLNRLSFRAYHYSPYQSRDRDA